MPDGAMGPHAALAERVLEGDVRAAGRLMRDLDDQIAGAEAALKLLYPYTGRAAIIGVTGHPGAGKSTIVDALIRRFRDGGRRVGVIAIDPSSPFSGGAILGDRIRMQTHATDPGVFIRSVATRGHLGGLSRSTADMTIVLDAAGCEVILIETVGVGQDEIDVVERAHTTIVVMVPGMGDEIQAIKAGLLEIADVLVVNKADHDGVDRTLRDLRSMLELRHAAGGPPSSVEIVPTVALTGVGIDRLLGAIERHQQQVRADDGQRRLRWARALLGEVLEARIRSRVLRLLQEQPQLVERIAERELDPYSAADDLTEAWLK